MAVGTCKNIAAIFDCTCCDGQSTDISTKLAKGEWFNERGSNLYFLQK